jgi:PII-like signaling protein
MAAVEDAVLLRVFMSERARHQGHPLHEAIVLAAREAGLAGATVLRGMMGFGRTGHIESAKILDLSDDLPVVVEIVDAEDRIEAFLPKLETMASAAVATLERVRVVRYGSGPVRASS